MLANVIPAYGTSEYGGVFSGATCASRYGTRMTALSPTVTHAFFNRMLRVLSRDSGVPTLLTRNAPCRWLRALYDYLAVKEGNADVIPLDIMPSDSALATGKGGPAAKTRQRARSNAPRTASAKIPGTVVGTVPESAASATAKARRFTSDSLKIAGNGALADDDSTEVIIFAHLFRERNDPLKEGDDTFQSP